MIYINKTASGFYVELNSELDPESNLVGTTWDEYLNGYWILLTEDQVSFRKENPDASVKEVFDMKLIEPVKPEVDELLLERDNKLKSIQSADNLSNKFGGANK